MCRSTLCVLASRGVLSLFLSLSLALCTLLIIVIKFMNIAFIGIAIDETDGKST